jgi:hypothetical protein
MKARCILHSSLFIHIPRLSVHLSKPVTKSVSGGMNHTNTVHCTVLYCTVLYCTVLYCTVLYCTVLYCTVLYCTVLYCSGVA